MDETQQHAIPWYRSKIMVGIGVSLVCKALVATGLIHEIGSDAEGEIANTLTTLVGAAGDGVALFGRLHQQHAPVITGSASSASVKHDEIAAAATPVQAPGDVAKVVDAVGEAAVIAHTLAPDNEIVGQVAALTQEVGQWTR
jgi:hypothetical protein